MDQRLRRATRLGAIAGYWAAGIGFSLGLVHRRDFGATAFAQVAAVVLAGCAGFALWFALVFSFAYIFPPSTDELTTSTDFPGAGKVVWPVIALLTAATIYLVIALR
jgi:hypothetical protein